MVSVLTFYSDDPSSNLARYLNFLCKKTKINEKEAGVGPYFKKETSYRGTSCQGTRCQVALSLLVEMGW